MKSASVGTAQRNDENPNQGEQPVPRQLDFAYYCVHDGFGSLLQLVSDWPKPFSFRIAVHSSSGRTAVTPPMRVHPQEKLSIDMQTLLGQLGVDRDVDFEEGSISVSYVLEKSPLLGQVTISDPSFGLVFESLMGENDPGQTDLPESLEGLWWKLTPGREAKVMVANTSNAEVAADVYLSFDNQRYASTPLTFEPYETKVLSIKQLLAKLDAKPKRVSEGGITIRGRGARPVLIATGMIADRKTGFSTTMHFMLMGMPMSNTLYASGVPIGPPSGDSPYAFAGTFSPHVIVRNLLSKSQTATVTVEYPGENGTQELALAPLTLPPFSTKDLSLDAAIEKLPLPLPYCSIRVQYSGEPGSAIVEVSSVEQNQNLVVDSKLGDPSDPMTGSGINPWHLDDHTEAVLFLSNAGDAPARIGFQIQANGVHYYLTDLKLNPHETRVIDIRKLRDMQKADFKGNKIPADATDGSLVWIRLDKVPVVGRLLVFDSRKSLSSNFDCTCTLHCDLGYDSLTVTPSSATLLVGGTQQFTATEAYGDCYGTLHYYNVTFGAFWTTGNSSVCTVNAAGVVTAVGAGSSGVTASYIDNKPRWFVADGVCNDNYITKSASGAVTIKPSINSISPTKGLIGNTVSVTISGSGFGTSPAVNAGTGITVSVNSANNTQIQASFAISASAPSGNHSVTVTAAGQTSASVNFFVQVPTSVAVISTTVQGLAVCPAGSAGWSRSVVLELRDQSNNPIQFPGIVMADTIATGSPNSCGVSSSLTGQFSTDSNGRWPDTYFICSTVCTTGNCQTNSTQTWTANGAALPQSVSVTYTCNAITVNGS